MEFVVKKHSYSVCLIDNWSLECAAILLEEGIEAIRDDLQSEYFRALNESMLSGMDKTSKIVDSTYKLDVYFGALANLMIALIMFDEVIYVQNGFEAAWRRFPVFAHKLKRIVHGQECPDATSREIEIKYGQSKDPGILYYSFLAKTFGADLLLNPLRAEHLTEAVKHNEITYGQFAEDILKVLDKSVEGSVLSLNSDLLRTGIIPNLNIPPVAALVYSNASSVSDILDASIDIRNSPHARDLRKVLGECVGDLHSTTKYPKIADSAIKAVNHAIKNFGILDPVEKGVNVGLSAMFVSFSYDIGKVSKPYMLFLRDIAKCRLELLGSSQHLKRLFNYSYQYPGNSPQ